MGKKVRIIVSLLVIAIIGILIVPPQGNTDEQVIVQSNIIESDDIILDQEIIDQAFQAYSIIETERVFTESNQSLVEQFLDENDLPSSSEKFGIEVQTVLFDSSQEQYTSSSILSIPSLVLTDSEGRLLDLGSIQTSFLGIVSDSNRGSETAFNLEGTVKFYLDDTLITTKKLYASEQGDSKTYDLSIVDSLPNTSFERPQAFTFTLSDEGRNWVDGSEHTYRVVLTDIDVEISSNNDIEQYTWNGEKIAYELNVKLDETKKVILGEDNKALSIFKNDSTISVCGEKIYTINAGVPAKTVTTKTPTIVVRDTNNNILAETSSSSFGNSSVEDGMACGKKHCYGSVITLSCSAPTSGIPRDADIIIEVTRNNSETKSYEVHTPLTQFNYYVQQRISSDPAPFSEKFTSNFGHDSELTVWDCVERYWRDSCNN